MTQQITRAPAAIARIRDLVQPALVAAVDRLDDPQMRLIARYQLGWCDVDGAPTGGTGGKAIRPALAVLSAEAVRGGSAAGVPAAVAVELVHNFSLLHDDVMDRDLERRHRPTGWVAFGEGQAILAGSALLTQAVQVLMEDSPDSRRCLPLLLATVQQLISGQSRDLLLEGRDDATLAEVLTMEAGKTAALLSCSAAIGALAAGAPVPVLTGLTDFGYELGVAFQLVDDVLGVVGDPAVTGKSSSSDVRAGKRSAPVVAALAGDSAASAELARMLAAGPPGTESDVERATGLVIDAGGLEWTVRAADDHLAAALRHLEALPLARPAADELAAVARYIVGRDR
jgi:geranylgeranyl diphosphate synthase type I